MNRIEAEALFRPLDLEQALHLLDALTWYPSGESDRWRKAAVYVDDRCPQSQRHPPAAYRALLGRVLDRLRQGEEPTATLPERWRLIPHPKELYELKYDTMALLYPDAWFTCMNMGYAPLDDVAPPLALGGAH